MTEGICVMCELFGLSSRKPHTVNQELKEFFSHCDEHPHGWGLALLDHNNLVIEKEPVKANASRYLKERLREPITSQIVLAHIRFATIGHMERRNCHPFTGTDRSGRKWTLIHNGTIFECEPMQKYFSIQKGETDSERLLLFLLDMMNSEIIAKGRSLTDEERFEIVDKLVTTAALQNKLNLLIYDGDLFYAHTNYRGSLYRLQSEDSVLISTQPLSAGAWEPVPFTQLIAYRREQQVLSGTIHGQEYILDQKKLDLVMLAFSGL